MRKIQFNNKQGIARTELWEEDGAEKQYKKNKKQLGPSWYYFDKKITFEFKGL